MDVAQLVISFLAGVGGGFIGAVTGGAGLLTIPALIFLGLPPNAAIATNSLATYGMFAGGIPEYQKARKIRWRAALKLAPLALLGGYIGSKILVQVNANALSLVIGILLILIIPVMLLNPGKGIRAFRPRAWQIIVGCVAYFLITVYGGFFGAGAGIFSTYSLTYFFGMTYIEAKASNFVPSFFLNTSAFIVFLLHGLVDFKLGLLMAVGMVLGGVLGAQTALRKGNSWVRIIFIVAIVASGIKLIFFP